MHDDPVKCFTNTGEKIQHGTQLPKGVSLPWSLRHVQLNHKIIIVVFFHDESNRLYKNKLVDFPNPSALYIFTNLVRISTCVQSSQAWLRWDSRIQGDGWWRVRWAQGFLLIEFYLNTCRFWLVWMVRFEVGHLASRQCVPTWYLHHSWSFEILPEGVYMHMHVYIYIYMYIYVLDFL